MQLLKLKVLAEAGAVRDIEVNHDDTVTVDGAGDLRHPHG
jgi:hypothetical protein